MPKTNKERLEDNNDSLLRIKEKANNLPDAKINITNGTVDGHTLILSGEPPAPVLPYIELDYIESTATQYINTLFNPSNLTKLEISFAMYNLIAYQALCGVRYSNKYMYMLNTEGTSANNKEVGYYTNYNKFNLSFSTWNVKTLYIQDKNQFSISNENGSDSRTFTTGTFTINNPIYLFGFNDGGNVERIGNTRIYYCKIYDNGLLVRDFIPVRRKSDNEVCLYEKCNNEFYINAGTGVFTAGPEKE